jgi:DNA helicase-2/ATP-dependent DNA helicase PcrA
MNSANINYQEAYNKLNSNQKEAVVSIEGPVMVLAGPGTGKTQVLGTRIGYILENTDTQAHNILCLTYTDAGVVAMRERLIKFIGKEAYKVQIHTFHSFCNKVIQEHSEHFRDPE